MNTTRDTTLRPRRTRRGITLVEMMVAMALTLGIMLILTEAFKISLDFVRIANANGTMMNHLAGAGNMLDHDLSAEHFLPEAGKPNGGVRLSDQKGTPPRAGFFHIESRQPVYEAFRDSEGNTLSTATNHSLHFTSLLKGGSDSEVFLGISPAGVPYRSRAAEVAWFLVPTGEVTSPTGLPLHNLVRRYRLVALDDDSRASLRSAVADSELISVPNPNATNTVNTLADVRTLANRIQVPAAPRLPNSLPQFQQNTPRYGEDVVLTNVLSFEVLVWWDGGAVTNRATPPPRPYTAGNSEYPYDYLYATNGVFDTFTGTNAAPSMRVRGLQITIRICDPRVGIARQNTWKFAL
jgi:hypothetical protein